MASLGKSLSRLAIATTKAPVAMQLIKLNSLSTAAPRLSVRARTLTVGGLLKLLLQTQQTAASQTKKRWFATDMATKVREEHSIEGMGKEKETSASNKPIGELICADHKVVAELFARLKAKGTSATDKQVVAWRIIKELSVHACVEEEVLYPALNAHREGQSKEDKDKAKQYHDHSLDEHSGLKKLLYELDSVIDGDLTHSRVPTLIQQLETEVQHHVREEETNVLPFLARCLSEMEQIELGCKYNKYKPQMPTRPHPGAPPGNYLGDRALAMADALRDKVRASTNTVVAAATTTHSSLSSDPKPDAQEKAAHVESHPKTATDAPIPSRSGSWSGASYGTSSSPNFSGSGSGAASPTGSRSGSGAVSNSNRSAPQSFDPNKSESLAKDAAVGSKKTIGQTERGMV